MLRGKGWTMRHRSSCKNINCFMLWAPLSTRSGRWVIEAKW